MTQFLLRRQKQKGIFLPLLFEQYALSDSASSVVVRRDILDQVGYFDGDLLHGEDWDLWIRLAKICHVDFTPEAVVGIRVHDQSAQRQARPDRALQFFQQHLMIYAKWPEEIAKRTDFAKGLRRNAIQIMLPLLRNPVEVIRFYKSLARHPDELAQNLFKCPIDFCWEIGFAVARIIYSRLRRVFGING